MGPRSRLGCFRLGRGCAANICSAVRLRGCALMKAREKVRGAMGEKGESWSISGRSRENGKLQAGRLCGDEVFASSTVAARLANGSQAPSVT